MRTLALLFFAGCSDSPEPPPAAPETALVRHSFGTVELAPLEELEPCVSWTLENEEAIYVQTATISNDGFFHHSNWTVVPEASFAGPDGFWDCGERGFSQVAAAVAGTVLMAQSTQSFQEEQAFPEGVVVKIPPRHKIVAGAHLLNASNRSVRSELRLVLEIVHPRNVRALLAPFHLDNRMLAIPPRAEARFTIDCDMNMPFTAAAMRPIDMKIHYVLPHFHYRANFWRLEVIGGPMDGRLVHEVAGFTGDPNGIAIVPPLDMTGATGLRMTCGFANETDRTIGWGIGDEEMCEMLGLAESDTLIDVRANGPNTTRMEGGIVMNDAPCGGIGIGASAGQTMPSAEELAAPLYVPESNGTFPTTPECVDTPADAVASGPATLSNLRDAIFRPSCSYSACHGGAPELDLTAADLHAELMNHELAAGVDVPLVDPGNPEGSYLYRALSQCEPQTTGGAVLPHMPLNAPTLLDPGAVAMVREWIAAGALDD
jgi:hypothetical protein